MASKDIVVGETYNGLLIQKYLGVTNKRHLWEVRCSCGRVKPPMRKDSILKSKGKCLCKKTPEGFMDLSGKVFNKLRVVSLSHTSKGQSHWNVVCDCGRCYTSRRDSLQRNIDGCGRHIRPHQHLDNNITVVDVSTETHPNTFTKVNTDKFYEYMCEGGWWAVSYAGEDAYVQGSYNKTPCCIHQLISGSFWEEDVVTDHINGDTLDNTTENLRITDKQGNAKNRKVPKNNTSGYQGISELPNGKYRAYVTVNDIQKGLGTYLNIEDAIKARGSGLKFYGFHENHDRKT